MTLAIGCDHAGFELKNYLKEALTAAGHKVLDYGTTSPESCDYPDFAHQVAMSVIAGKAELGILMCGSGNGINMAANKHQEIRSALCWMPEIASLARQHNNANICTLPARYLENEKALEIVQLFLATPFEGGRHERRVNKIAC